MTRRRAPQTALLACFAASGLVAAHVLAYVIALPDAMVRSAVLRNTGHGYLGPAIVIATVAMVFGLIGSAALGYSHGRRGTRGHMRWRDAALRIAGTQTVAFLLLEGAERVVSGRRPVALDVTLLAVGVVVQALLGLLAGAVVVAVRRVARAAGAARRAFVPARLPLLGRVYAMLGVRAPRLVAAGALPARGPPVSPR